ncbi:MAG: metallophosphoesterase [Clostridia bacterium]|nr:metallophosphoesterase [Clostridia bacterium]
MEKYYEKTIEKISEKVKNTVKNGDFSFIFITDLHTDFKDNKEPVLRQCKAAVKLAKNTLADCIIIGGDIIHGIFEKEYSLNTLKMIKDEFLTSSVPVITVHGNHDDNAYQSDKIPWTFDPAAVPYQYIITGEEFVKTITIPLAKEKDVHDKTNPFSTYYFADFPEKKKRIVVLDGYDYPLITDGKYARYSSENWNRFSDGQLKWLAERALDVKNEGWEIIITAHSVLDSNIGVLRAQNYAEVLKIISAFNDRRRIKDEKLNIDVDYKDAAGKVRLGVYGHTHVDSYSYADGLLHMVTGCSEISHYDEFLYNTDFKDSPLREEKTEKEPLFDYYIVSNDKVFRYRFGAGKDLELTL